MGQYERCWKLHEAEGTETVQGHPDSHPSTFFTNIATQNISQLVDMTYMTQQCVLFKRVLVRLNNILLLALAWSDIDVVGPRFNLFRYQ